MSSRIREDLEQQRQHLEAVETAESNALGQISRAEVEAAVLQTWLLIESNPDALLSIRHFARRPGVSARRLHVRQAVLLEGIHVITQGAFRQEVFRNILVAVHALGWLYIRVGALSDGADRRLVLVKTWNAFLAWLLTKNPASDLLVQVYDATFRSFEGESGASKKYSSMGTGVADVLASSNSALEGDQWLVADLAMHTAAWGGGDNVRVFS